RIQKLSRVKLQSISPPFPNNIHQANQWTSSACCGCGSTSSSSAGSSAMGSSVPGGDTGTQKKEYTSGSQFTNWKSVNSCRKYCCMLSLAYSVLNAPDIAAAPARSAPQRVIDERSGNFGMFA